MGTLAIMSKPLFTDPEPLTHIANEPPAPYLPFAFPEHGIHMLANVLHSQRAIATNIHISCVFTRMREMLLAHHEVLQELEESEGRLTTHDEEIQAIFFHNTAEHLTALVSPAERQGGSIGSKPSATRTDD